MEDPREYLTAAEALERGILSPGAVADMLSVGHSPEELGFVDPEQVG